MSKLEVEMYACSKSCRDYGIGKIVDITENGQGFKGDLVDIQYKYSKHAVENKDIEASFNIIDLIKSKDIILGKDDKLYQCWKIYKDYVFTYSKNKYGDTITLVDYQIDRILTKEQFESMSYRIGE